MDKKKPQIDWRAVGAGIGLGVIALLMVSAFFGGGLKGPAQTGAGNAVTFDPATETPPFTPFVMGAQPGVAPPPVVSAQNRVDTAPPIDETGGVPNYVPPTLLLTEGHWQGMDTMPLTSSLRKALRYPRGLTGLLIDEVTLNAAKSGMLAGDVIVMVGDVRVHTLEDFKRESRKYRTSTQAPITVMRKKGFNQETWRYDMEALTYMLQAKADLGFVQVEGAPMILPGAERPHGYRGPCTDCHTIGKGFELTPDPDLITLPPPPISQQTAQNQLRPHRDRGPCVACHMIR